MALKRQIEILYKIYSEKLRKNPKNPLYILPIVVNMHKNNRLEHFYLYFYRPLDKI